MEVYLRYWMNVIKNSEYNVQCPTKARPKPKIVQLSIYWPDPALRPELDPRPGKFSQFIAGLEYLVAGWLTLYGASRLLQPSIAAERERGQQTWDSETPPLLTFTSQAGRQWE